MWVESSKFPSSRSRSCTIRARIQSIRNSIHKQHPRAPTQTAERDVRSPKRDSITRSNLSYSPLYMNQFSRWPDDELDSRNNPTHSSAVITVYSPWLSRLFWRPSNTRLSSWSSNNHYWTRLGERHDRGLIKRRNNLRCRSCSGNFCLGYRVSSNGGSFSQKRLLHPFCLIPLEPQGIQKGMHISNKEIGTF